MAVLAGVGAQFFESTPEGRPNWRRLLIACVGITAAGIIGESFLAGRHLTFLSAIRTLGILLTFSIILLLIRPEKDNPGFIRESLWQWIVVIFVGIDLLLIALPLIPTLPPTIYSRSIASAEFIKTQPGEYRFFVDDRFVYTTTFTQYFRFKTFGPLETDYWQDFKETLVPNFGVYVELPSSNNDDPLTVGNWQRLTRKLRKADPAQRAQLLSMMNVGYLLGNPTDNTWPIIYNSEAVVIQHVPQALPRAYFVAQAYYARDSAEAIARLTAPDFDSRREVVIMDDKIRGGSPAISSPTTPYIRPVRASELDSGKIQLTVDAPSSGFVVLTDTFYPGWQATIDGQATKIWQANLAFRAVAVETGRHEIRFNYRPRSFTVGLWISIVTGVIVVLAIGRLIITQLRGKAFDNPDYSIRTSRLVGGNRHQSCG
jgi:hypothetical protein